MIEARLSPDGFVAQLLKLPIVDRTGERSGTGERWVLAYVHEEFGFMVRVLEEGEANDWPRLEVTGD